MREHLFRGKRKDNGEWLTGFFRVNSFYKNAIIENPESGFPYIVIPETVGEYTGLQDKNRMKIFEGDVVRIRNEGGGYLDEEYKYAKVKWKNSYAAFVLFNNDWCDDEGFWDFSPSRCEVIGNIHDNPELLEVNNE